MKHLRSKFYAAVKDWDRKHRLVGRTPIEQLYAESLVAARKARLPIGNVIVDIGAGSGILGIAWLLGSRSRKVVFVEPDLKKAAFLRVFFAPTFKGRAFVIADPIQNVSRETLSRLIGQPDAQYSFVARAFSSDKPLKQTVESSWIINQSIFTFETKNEREFSLQRLKM